MKKVVFLYSYKPSGHARAAQALAEAFREGGKAEVAELEVAGDLHPLLGPAVARAYLELIQRGPKVWDAIYDHRGLARATKELRELMQLFQGFKLKQRILRLKPDLVVATHALPCGSAAALKRRGELACPLAAAPTDFYLHGYWLDPAVDLYLSPRPGAAAELGVEASRTAETGIPISPRFARRPAPAEARRRLGLPEDAPTVLVSGGSRGLGPLPETVETLRQAEPSARFLVLCGNNADLHERLRRGFAGDPKVKVFGYEEDTAPLFAAADVMVGKAGGLTLAEALASSVPALIFEPFPGQERRNTEFLLARGAAWQASTLSDLASKLKTLLAKGPAWQALRVQSQLQARPASALEGLQALEALLERPRRPLVSKAR